MKNLLAVLKRLHSDECGAEGLEKLLIVAALVLPLLGILIFYGGAIKEWLEEQWNQVKDESGNTLSSP